MADVKKTHAFVVGIEKYLSDSLDLCGPGWAAQAFTHWLLSREVEPEKITLFLSELPAVPAGGCTNPTPPLPNSLPPITRHPATQDAILGHLTDGLFTPPGQDPPRQGDLLIVFWCGHGFMAPRGDRRLLYANSSTVNALNLSHRSLVDGLRALSVHFKQQLFITVACTDITGWTDHVAAPSGDFPRRLDFISPVRGENQQFVLHATYPGQTTEFPHGQNVFLDTLLQCEAMRSGPWPPNMVRTTHQVRIELVHRSNAEGGVLAAAALPTVEANDWSRAPVTTNLASLPSPAPAASDVGRRLVHKTVLWRLTRDSSVLPGLREYRRFRRIQNPADKEQAEMLDKARRRILVRWSLSLAAAVVLLLIIGGIIGTILLRNAAELAYRNVKDADYSKIQGSLKSFGKWEYAALARRFESEVDELKRGREDGSDRSSRTFPTEHTQMTRFILAAAVVGHPEMLKQYLRSSAYPTVRTLLIRHLGEVLCPQQIIDVLAQSVADKEEEAPLATAGLILALGEFGWEDLTTCRVPPPTPDSLSCAGMSGTPLSDWLLQTAEHHPDPGVHAAAIWLVRRIMGARADKAVDDIRRRLRTLGEARLDLTLSQRQWYVDVHGQTMVVLPEVHDFSLGLRLQGRELVTDERFFGYPRHRRKIPRVFAISMYEVTNKEYSDYCCHFPDSPDGGKFDAPKLRSWRETGRQDFQPTTNLHWDEAARFCNWLSRITRDSDGKPLQPCYVLREKTADVIADVPCIALLPDDSVDRNGYRLPTETEWEYTCRGGTKALRFCGNEENTLATFAYYGVTGRGTSRVGWYRPNQFGLFDMLGNAAEWCHDQLTPLAAGKEPIPDCPKEHSHGTHYCRGGHYQLTANSLITTRRWDVAHDDDRHGIRATAGFRVARTLRGGCDGRQRGEARPGAVPVH